MSGISYTSCKHIICLFIIIVLTSISYSAPLFNVPIELKQPDGSIINVFASGDEYYHRVHDKDNYTITIDNKTGNYVYALLVNGQLTSSKYIVGKVNPSNTDLVKGISISPDKILKYRLDRQPEFLLKKKNSSSVQSLTNLVVFIRFSDENEFSDNISLYENYFNSINSTSLKNYYNEVSWGKLDIQSYFYPAPASGVISYQDINPRSYYEKYSAANPNGYQDNEADQRENALINRAVSFIKTQVSADLNLDNNNDGMIDNMCFIISGNPAGWSDLLWPHMSVVTGQNILINGKKVYTYNFQLQTFVDPYVLCHEMGHSLGAPDLYRYENPSDPVGQWDIMANGNGTHMLNYMKYKYFGWIEDIPEITSDGIYSLRPSTEQTQNVYRIKSARNDYESFILEYRVKNGLYEKNLPGSGLIIYRINERINGNAYAPPDEVYVYRPGGNTISNGILREAAFGQNYGRTAINDTTNPFSFLSDGGPGGLDIYNISGLGDSMTFSVKIIDHIPGNTEPYLAEKNNFNWFDISKTGTEIINWKNGTVKDASKTDDGYTSAPIPLGFSFNFFGQTYNSLYAGVNGLVSFTKKVLNSSANSDENELGYFAPASWPGNLLFPNSIAIAYNDFDLNKKDGYGNGKVLYQTIDNKFILSWENVGTFSKQGDTTNSFQLVLDGNTGSVILNYKKFGLESTRSSVAIGMQGIPPTGVSWIEGGLPKDRIPMDNTSVLYRPAAVTGIDDDKIFASGFALHQNYPNPFNPSTVISFQLSVYSHATLKVYDILGNEIATLVNEEKAPGNYEIKFSTGSFGNAGNLASGVYFYRLQAGNFVQTKKLVVLK